MQDLLGTFLEIMKCRVNDGVRTTEVARMLDIKVWVGAG